MDKGAVVQLEYGVEGFATPKHLVKEDNTHAKEGEKLAFKVIEFNKDSKRIILSHSRTFEDAQRNEARVERAKAPRSNKGGNRANSEIPAIQNQAATTSLGENDALAALKAKMEKGE